MHSSALKPITIQIVDDHEMLDLAIQSLLDKNLYQCRSSAKTVREAIDQAAVCTFDLIILDLYLPDGLGEEIIDFYATQKKRPKILIHSGSSDSVLLQRCLKKGADGCITKASGCQEFIEAVRTVAVEKKTYLCPQYRYLEASLKQHSSRLDELTTRETEVAHLVAQGKKLKEVAELLCISPKTADCHKTSAMRKLGVNKSVNLTRILMEDASYPVHKNEDCPS